MGAPEQPGTDRELEFIEQVLGRQRGRQRGPPSTTSRRSPSPPRAPRAWHQFSRGRWRSKPSGGAAGGRGVACSSQRARGWRKKGRSAGIRPLRLTAMAIGWGERPWRRRASTSGGRWIRQVLPWRRRVSAPTRAASAQARASSSTNLSPAPPSWAAPPSAGARRPSRLTASTSRSTGVAAGLKRPRGLPGPPAASPAAPSRRRPRRRCWGSPAAAPCAAGRRWRRSGC